MDGPRPSSVAAPSIWYAAVATPQRNPAGNAGIGTVISRLRKHERGSHLNGQRLPGEPATRPEPVSWPHAGQPGTRPRGPFRAPEPAGAGRRDPRRAPWTGTRGRRAAAAPDVEPHPPL